MKIVLSDGLKRGGDQFRLLHRDIKGDRPGRIPKTVNVFIQTEYPIIVKPDSFEYPVTIEETMVKYGNLRLGLVVEVSVDVDFEIHR